jgi:hypothetical protein
MTLSRVNDEDERDRRLVMRLVRMAVSFLSSPS